MSSDRLQKQDRSTGAYLLGAALIAFAGAAAFYFVGPTGEPAPTATAPRPLQQAVVPAAPTPAPPPVVPSFDIVRVAPDGHAVVAGRAAPGAVVTLHDGGQDLASATADRNGEFVLLPEQALKPGSRELTLSERATDGTRRDGQGAVVVLNEKPPTPDAATSQSPPAAPVAVLLPNDASPPRVLQGSKPGKLALDSVDYGEHGDIRFAGSAKPSAPVRVYVDNQPVGETRSNESGQWSLTPPADMKPGVHQLRVDEIARSGRVQNRVEVPFQRAAMSVPGLEPDRAIVQPGQTLWRIARQTYGSGTRYTVIFMANRDQIRNPNLIYPGQVFSVPTESR